jgi:MinD superfamily P-loop ATPase
MTTLQRTNPYSDNAVHRIVEMAAGMSCQVMEKMMQAKWLIFQLDESMDI